MGRTNMDIRGRLARYLSAWREEPWPLLSWSETTRAYHVTIIAMFAVKFAALAGVWALVSPNVAALNWNYLLPALALDLAMSPLIYRSTAVMLRFNDSIFLALAISGHPIEAAICASVGMLILGLRKPLPFHLLATNILGATWLIGGIACAVDIAGRYPSLSGQWVATVFIGFVAARTVVNASQHVIAKMGAYTPDWRSSVRDCISEMRSFIMAEAPLVVLVGTMLGTGKRWILPFLLAPRLMSLDLARHSDALIEAQLEATVDPLTELPNRRSLEQVADRIFDSGTASDAWLIMLDLDNFKRLNDTLGHETGDRALRAVADQIRATVRASDHSARYGGEEFVVVVEQGDRSTIADVAERIRAQVEANLTEFGVTVSIGVHHAYPGESFDAALHHADTAMYLSKRLGKNRVTFSDGEGEPRLRLAA